MQGSSEFGSDIIVNVVDISATAKKSLSFCIIIVSYCNSQVFSGVPCTTTALLILVGSTIGSIGMGRCFALTRW